MQYRKTCVLHPWQPDSPYLYQSGDGISTTSALHPALSMCSQSREWSTMPRSSEGAWSARSGRRNEVGHPAGRAAPSVGKAIRTAGQSLDAKRWDHLKTKGPPVTTYLYKSVAGTLTRWCFQLRRAFGHRREGRASSNTRQRRGKTSDEAGHLLAAMAENNDFYRRKSVLL